MTFSELPDVMGAKEAAEFLRVDVRTVYKMVNDRELPAARIGRQKTVRIRRSDLEALFRKEAA